MKRIGLLSENTAAYALMPDLVGHRTPHYGRIIPIRFSSKREGDRTANEGMASRRVTLLAAYAKRPKVIHSGDNEISVKINSSLSQAKERVPPSGFQSWLVFLLSAVSMNSQRIRQGSTIEVKTRVGDINENSAALDYLLTKLSVRFPI